jgi:hypothetical protein
MHEVVPGIYHWSAFHESIGQDAHSYYAVGPRALIDPMPPPGEGLEWLRDEPRPERIVMSQRHHWRACEQFSRQFGIPILCQEDGAAQLEPGREVETFAFGGEPAPGIVAHEVWPGWPGETALQIPAAGALALADAVVRDADGALAFVPDSLLGDDPDEAREGLGTGLRKLAEELDFDTLLLAHGEPRAYGGREELLAFLDGR